jgi:hypothetical protein
MERSTTSTAEAWCFQEARLSHRLLTFDRLQMSYTCLHHGLLESRELLEGARREEKNTFLPRLRAAREKDDQTKAWELVSTWYQAVTDYTSRDSTFPQDKLVAIAGIARILGNFIEDKYSAGLWHKTLPQSLLWSPYEEETFPHPPHKSSLPSAYRAPSWSWASTEGPISNFICRQPFGRKLRTQILQISTELQGSDLYGQIKAASIKIRGPLQQVVCGKGSMRWPYQPNLLPLDYPSLSEPSALEEGSNIGHAIFDIEWLEKGSKLWVLQITDVYGLMLVPVKKDSLDIFSRIGVCHFASSVKSKNVLSIEII